MVGQYAGVLRGMSNWLYRHRGEWQWDEDQGGDAPVKQTCTCRFSLWDPRQTGEAGLKAAVETALALGTSVERLRYLRVHPDDPKPAVMATIQWEGTTLQLQSWSQINDFTATAIGTCVLRG